MINCAIIGYGYWGPNLVRNFSSAANASVKLVADLRPERLNLVKKNYPMIEVTTDIDSIWGDAGIDAVIIATPVFTHFDLAKKALNSGKHVLLEKPMTDTVAHALELIELAQSKGKVLMVDHTFLYTSAVQKMKSLIDQGDIGKVKYFDSTRINLGLIQQDVNVLWDLAPHDISILDYLMPEKPRSVQATGVSHIHNGIENIAYLTVNYDSDFIAHFSCSWSSPVKIRTMLLGGDKKMVVFNDMEPTEKIKIYDTAHTVSSDEEKQRVLVDYRVGDVYIPKLEIKEALGGMAKDFI
ncbi:MAG: Gfo/Idh/MocA family oxidoreductase, partial [Flavobacteriales bacterium]|nr:Gfo/Idh/MocA family oxidoreductase [Flavobacteriales bacterium]